MAEYLVHGTDLSAVADAIRSKGGTTELLEFPQGFVSAVESIQTGGQNNLAKVFQGELTELVDPEVTAINQGYMFYRNAVMTRVELPNAQGSCPDYAFYYATGLQSCVLPQITSLGLYCFMSAGLVSAEFPLVQTVGGYAFRNCTKLTRLSLPALESVTGQYNFNGCSSLTTLILGGPSMVTLTATNVLGNTPIASGTGYIYVPSDLVSTYQADSVWSTYAAQFRAIEDYPDA